jgi:hypothetical protein
MAPNKILKAHQADRDQESPSSAEEAFDEMAPTFKIASYCIGGMIRRSVWFEMVEGDRLVDEYHISTVCEGERRKVWRVGEVYQRTPCPCSLYSLERCSIGPQTSFHAPVGGSFATALPVFLYSTRVDNTPPLISNILIYA